MNATPTSLSPGNAVQAQTPSARQNDASAAEVPFSRVLSGEIARAAREALADAPTVTDGLISGDSAALATTAPDLTVGLDLRAGLDLTGELDVPAAFDATAGLDSTAGLDLTAGLVLVADEAATSTPAPATATADTLAPVTDTFLGLPVTPDVLRPAPVVPATRSGATAVRMSAAEGGQAVNLVNLPAPSAGMKKETPVLPLQTVAQSSDAAKSDTAAVFAERLAAARQGDPASASERIAELMSQPGMRAVAAPPVDAAPVQEAGGNRLAPSVGTAAWGQALGEKLVWMASGNQQTASLTLNPPNLGPLQIVVNVSNDQATASFFSAQPEVRQALESAFPKLREMMGEAGIQLGQATVSAETPQQHNEAPERQGQRNTSEFALSGEAVVDLAVGAHTPSRTGRGLVDTFA